MNWNTNFRFALMLLIAIFPCTFALATSADIPLIAPSGPLANSSVADPCDLVESIDIPDPAGDASVGAPLWVDTLGVQLQQLRSGLNIRWKTAASDFSNDDVLFDNEQHFRLFFDTDHNSQTGQPYEGLGAELKITLGDYRGRASLHYFDEPGNWIGEILVPIRFMEDGFALMISMEAIPSMNFLLGFESIGTWVDRGGPADIMLESIPSGGELRISSANVVLESGPRLMNLPSPSNSLPLIASLFIDDITTVLDPSLVKYHVSHPVPHRISEPGSIISIDADGIAHYNSEGYVTATFTINACGLTSEEVLLATGDVYGEPITQKAIGVFPSEYIPASSSFSFGDMITRYPDMMRFLNMGYDVSSEMYGGFQPFGGDKQIFSPIVLDGHCGASGNPLAISPGCYMNYGDASPQYNVIVHEMGHNFSESKGMLQLLFSDGLKIGSVFSECVASLPVIFFEEEIIHNGADYKIYPGSFEYEYAESNREYYCAEPQRGLPEFEQLITDGLIEGIFDVPNGLFGPDHVFCSFFEAFSCDYIGGENLFKHHMLRRFLNVFGNAESPEFIPKKVETYFAAAYSVAAGRDMRERLNFWGFTIDDEYYAQIEPIIRLKVREDVIFQSGFE